MNLLKQHLEDEGWEFDNPFNPLDGLYFGEEDESYHIAEVRIDLGEFRVIKRAFRPFGKEEEWMVRFDGGGDEGIAVFRTQVKPLLRQILDSS